MTILLLERYSLIIHLNSHAVSVCREISDLGTKDKVTPLGISQENDEEHDSKTSNILSTTSQSWLKLGHGFVETDVFEYLSNKENAIRQQN